jgi:hypothetical protein
MATKEKEINIKNIVKNELPSDYFNGIVFTNELSDDYKTITIIVTHKYVNRFMYNNCIYKNPFINYALEYGLEFNTKDYHYYKKDYPIMWIEQTNMDIQSKIVINSSEELTGEQYDFLVNAFYKLIQKMNKNMVISIPYNNNNGFYTSTNAELTEEGEYENDEILYASSNEPLEDNYQVEIINTTILDLSKLNDEDNIHVINNSSLKEPLREKIDKLFEDKKLCKGIGKGYMNDSIRDADIIILIKDDNILLGFTTIKVKNTTLYIDLICSNNEYRKVGSVIMNKIKELGRYIGFTHVTLNSVHSAYNFYTKHKYKITREQPEKNLVHMKRRLVPKIVEENVGYEGNTNSNNSNNTNNNTNNSNSNNSNNTNNNTNNSNSNSNNNKKKTNRKKTNKKGGYRKKHKTHKHNNKQKN